MAAFILWCILFILCWPVALLALVLYPFVWLIMLPFRIVGIAVHGVFGLLAAMLLLPVRFCVSPGRFEVAARNHPTECASSSPHEMLRV